MVPVLVGSGILFPIKSTTNRPLKININQVVVLRERSFHVITPEKYVESGCNYCSSLELSLNQCNFTLSMLVITKTDTYNYLNTKIEVITAMVDSDLTKIPLECWTV